MNARRIITGGGILLFVAAGAAVSGLLVTDFIGGSFIQQEETEWQPADATERFELGRDVFAGRDTITARSTGFREYDYSETSSRTVNGVRRLAPYEPSRKQERAELEATEANFAETSAVLNRGLPPDTPRGMDKALSEGDVRKLGPPSRKPGRTETLDAALRPIAAGNASAEAKAAKETGGRIKSIAKAVDEVGRDSDKPPPHYRIVPAETQ